MKSPEEIAMIIDNCKRIGVESVEIDGVKYNVAQQMAREQNRMVPDLPPEQLVVPLSPFDDMSDDEIKYYATPYYDVLQAEKESRANRIEEEK